MKSGSDAPLSRSQTGQSDPPVPWKTVLETMAAALDRKNIPSVTEIASEKHDPYAVLVSTIISLRTKDAVTIEASRRLLEAAPDACGLAALSRERIARLIYPAGFYNTKAANLKKIAELLLEAGGEVPRDREVLLRYPGVGLKTANLTLGLGYGQPLICVDGHVHRISNRMGWIATATPDESEKALMEILPEQYRISINTLLVAYGQRICTPQSPHCSDCPVYDFRKRNGVTRSR